MYSVVGLFWLSAALCEEAGASESGFVVVRAGIGVLFYNIILEAAAREVAGTVLKKRTA